MKDLEQYFEKARKQKELLRLTEIEDILNFNDQQQESRPDGVFFKRFQRRHLATSGLFSILAAGVVAFFVIRANENATEEVFIPPTQRRVMHLVKNISEGPQNQEIKVSQFGIDTNPNTSGIPVHLRSKFELSEVRLELLGIKFFEDYIQYEGNVKGKGYVAFRVLKKGLKPPPNFAFLEVSGIQRPGIKEYAFYPWFMTDEAGYQGFRYQFRDEPAGKTTSSFFLNAIDELIPIQVHRPGFEKVIFWFSQSPELLNILESAASASTTTQLSDHPSLDEQSQTIQVEIFPTITSGDVQVIANVQRKEKLEIALLNSSGEILQVPVNQVLTEGEHKFTMTLSPLRKGLYFLRIKSGADRVTIHRLFKE